MAEGNHRWRLALAGLGGRTLAILACIILLIAAASRFDAALDLSPDRRFTLDPDLIRILGAQQEAVRIVTVWERDAYTDPLIRPLEDALHRMAALNPLVTVERIDPVLQIPLLESHRKRYGEASSPSIYLCRGERAFKIPVTRNLRQILQREIGGGLLALAETVQPTARFLTGHGELVPDGSINGCDALIRAYELSGMRTVIGGKDPIDPASLLVLVGPTFPYGAVTIAAIEQHLIDGGAMQIFADDRMPADLARLLRKHGILAAAGIPQGNWQALLADDPEAAPSTIIVSRTRHEILQEAEFPYGNLSISSDLMNDHPAMGGLRDANRRILSPWSTPIFELVTPDMDEAMVTALAQAGKLPPWDPENPPVRLMVSAPGDSWTTVRSEAPRVPADLAQHPPMTIALATVLAAHPSSARQGQQARIVIWGSRAAVANGVLAMEQYANADAAVAMARWALNQGKANPIPASESAAFRVETDDQGLSLITALLVAIMPCLAIGAAILAWLHRR